MKKFLICLIVLVLFGCSTNKENTEIKNNSKHRTQVKQVLCGSIKEE